MKTERSSTKTIFMVVIEAGVETAQDQSPLYTSGRLDYGLPHLGGFKWKTKDVPAYPSRWLTNIWSSVDPDSLGA